jgi:membrane-associated phospholipid phosphatase
VTVPHGRQWVVEVLRETRDADSAVYRAIATAPMPALDRPLRRISRLADHSKLWLGIAGLLAAVPGRPRHAAATGVLAIGMASATVNIVGKGITRRRRPDPVAALVPIGRRVRMPGSSSFPSGHSASAFAFATAVSSDVPWLSLPIYFLAASVAYSRVHTGAHYPGDVVVGALVGGMSASVASKITSRVGPT